jgi:1,4-dihydroxy-2-naphthoate polyprenyltransferase
MFDRPSLVAPWIIAARPKTLPAAIVPVIVGTALAVRDGVFNPWAALAALVCAVLIQIGTNFANDVYDFKKGADTTRIGPTRVTTAGLLSPQAVERGTWAAFGLAALLGLYLVSIGGWPILVLGLASILAGLAYTAGPFPLGYNGLGDIAVFIFFGLVAVVGTYYVQALTAPAYVFVAAVPVGAIATAIIVVNNIRDADTDKVAGKRTLAVLLGRDAARTEYAFLLALAYAVPPVLWLGFGFSGVVLLPLLSLPLAWQLVKAVRHDLGPALNRSLVGTSRLLLIYGLLFALGLMGG